LFQPQPFTFIVSLLELEFPFEGIPGVDILTHLAVVRFFSVIGFASARIEAHDAGI